MGFMEPATIDKQPLPKLIQPQYFLYGLNFLSILFLVSQTVYSEPTNIMQTIFIFPCAVSWKKLNLKREIWPQSYAKLQQKDLRAVWVLYNKTLQLIWDVNFKKKTCYFLWMFVVAGVSVRVAYSMAKLMFMLFLVSTMLMLIASVYE